MTHSRLMLAAGALATPVLASVAIATEVRFDRQGAEQPPATDLVGVPRHISAYRGLASPLVILVATPPPRRGCVTIRPGIGDLRERHHPEIAVREMEDGEAGNTQRASGTQAVMRAIDILVAVGDGPISLPDLVARVNIPKPTCHRIATALAERGLLSTSGRSGYRLGPLLRELGEKSGA